jgi:hypothetical protein
MDQRFFAKLNLSGREGKNLVPVDWLSRAITHLFTHAEHHGRTYHLTHPRPVTVRLIQTVIQEAIRKYSRRPPARPLSEEELANFEQLFHDQMLIYRSHWRDDPIFDRTNTDRVLGNLPCPEMDRELLLRVARYPIENNFNLNRHVPARRDFDMHECLEPLLHADSARQDVRPEETVGLQIDGSDGGRWQLLLRDGRVAAARAGFDADVAATCRLTSETFAALARRELNVSEAAQSLRLLIEGPPAMQPVVADAVGQILGPGRMVRQGATGVSPVPGQNTGKMPVAPARGQNTGKMPVAPARGHNTGNVPVAPGALLPTRKASL